MDCICILKTDFNINLFHSFMKTNYNFFLFFSFLLSLFACNKDNPTVINLTVVDYFTGEPLDSVLYYYSAYYRDQSHESALKWNRGARTDSTGKIEYTFSADEAGGLGPFIKDGYLSKINSYIKTVIYN